MEETEKQLKQLQILMEINLSLNLADLQIEVVLDKALEEMMKVVGAEAGSLWMKEEDDSLEVEAKVAKGPAAGLIKAQKLMLGEGIVGKVMSDNNPLLIENAKKDPRFARRFEQKSGYECRSMLCVPLAVRDLAFGAIQLINKKGDQLFSQDDLNLVRAVANTASLSIQNSRLFAKQQKLITNMLDAMVTAVELRSVESSGHATRISFYAECLGRKMKLANNQMMQLTWAALLHDIGKLGLSDEILKKRPEEYSADDWASYRKHPQFGSRIVAKFNAWDFLPDVYFGVLYHHENYDGTGYPNGQKQDLIPLAARIIRVADEFDHKIQKGIIVEQAVQGLKADGGTKLDPQVAEVFIRLVEEDLAADGKLNNIIYRKRGLEDLISV
ncbi:MAG: HD domain-containing phosphohydrolase [Bacillota bacterium]